MLKLRLRRPEILQIPIELVNDFLVNPLNSLRDFACVPTDAISPFFSDVERLDACLIYENPFDSITRTFDGNLFCDDEFFRYMHIDLGWKKDGLGISMCHIPYWKSVKRTVEDKDRGVYEDIEILQPFIKFDFVGRILAAEKSEILISAAQDLIFQLSYERSFYIHLITFDRFESVQTVQTLRTNNFNVAHLSIDRTAYKVVVDYDREDNIDRISTDRQYNAAFEGFRYAIQEERVVVPFHNDWEQETRGLEYLSDKDKVVKSPHSSDDLIQSIVGSAFNACNNEQPDTAGESEQPKETQDTKYDSALYSHAINNYDVELTPELRHPYYSIGIG